MLESIRASREKVRSERFHPLLTLPVAGCIPGSGVSDRWSKLPSGC